MKAIIFSILAGLGFGGSMFLRKLSVERIGMSAFILETIANFIFATIAVFLIFSFSFNQLLSRPSGIILSLVGGVSLGAGIVFFYLASKYGSVILPSLVAPVIGAIIASLLAVLVLGDKLSVVEIFGLAVTLFGLSIFIMAK